MRLSRNIPTRFFEVWKMRNTKECLFLYKWRRLQNNQSCLRKTKNTMISEMDGEAEISVADVDLEKANVAATVVSIAIEATKKADGVIFNVAEQ